MRQEIIFIIVGMALVTLLTRAAGFVINNKKSSASYEQWLKHIPTAMLTALIVPSLLMPRDTLFISVYNPYLLAGAISVLVALKTNSILATVGFGMTAMLLLRGFGI